MKNAEFFVNTYYTFADDIKDLDPYINKMDLIEVIKIVQKETIKETVQECAENVKLYFIDLEQSEQEIDKNSILSIADKLIKEL